MLRNPELTAVIEPVLRQALVPFGLERVDIAEVTDHAGEPIILAKVTYRAGARQMDGRALLDLVGEIMARIEALGDDRVVHLRHIYADGLPADDEFPRRRRVKDVAGR